MRQYYPASKYECKYKVHTIQTLCIDIERTVFVVVECLLNMIVWLAGCSMKMKMMLIFVVLHFFCLPPRFSIPIVRRALQHNVHAHMALTLSHKAHIRYVLFNKAVIYCWSFLSSLTIHLFFSYKSEKNAWVAHYCLYLIYILLPNGCVMCLFLLFSCTHARIVMCNGGKNKRTAWRSIWITHNGWYIGSSI